MKKIYVLLLFLLMVCRSYSWDTRFRVTISKMINKIVYINCRPVLTTVHAYEIPIDFNLGYYGAVDSASNDFITVSEWIEWTDFWDLFLSKQGMVDRIKEQGMGWDQLKEYGFTLAPYNITDTLWYDSRYRTQSLSWDKKKLYVKGTNIKLNYDGYEVYYNYDLARGKNTRYKLLPPAGWKISQLVNFGDPVRGFELNFHSDPKIDSIKATQNKDSVEFYETHIVPYNICVKLKQPHIKYHNNHAEMTFTMLDTVGIKLRNCSSLGRGYDKIQAVMGWTPNVGKHISAIVISQGDYEWVKENIDECKKHGLSIDYYHGSLFDPMSYFVHSTNDNIIIDDFVFYPLDPNAWKDPDREKKYKKIPKNMDILSKIG